MWFVNRGRTWGGHEGKEGEQNFLSGGRKWEYIEQNVRQILEILGMRGEDRFSPVPSSVRIPEMCSMLSMTNYNGSQTLKSIFTFPGTQYQYHK